MKWTDSPLHVISINLSDNSSLPSFFLLINCNLFIYLFVCQIVNPGDNLIRRQSIDSSVTIPFERTFRDVDTNRPRDETAESEQFNLCGCGWPQYMLVPKGEQGRGTLCDLFVMISNYADDRIDQDLVGTCNDASSFW